MKKTVKIPKSRLYAPIDFGEAIATRRVCDVSLAYTEYGFVQFASNKLVLFDAYSSAHKYLPFAREFGVVGFPYCLCCMTDGGERVAYCGFKFGEEKIDRWELCFPGERDKILGKLAYSSDAAASSILSGVCCLADEVAYKTYASHLSDEVHPLAGHIILNGQTHTTVEMFGNSYAVFSTGWGDGVYRSYVGLTEDGRIMNLIVDFGMIDYPSAGDETVDVEIEEEDTYLYDPAKSESENNVARWTLALERATSPVERLMAYSRRGYAYHSMGKFDAALSDYEAAATECSHVTDRGELLRAWSVYENAASLYIQKNDYMSAIKIMQAALSIRDNFYAGAYFRLIDLYLITKNGEKAFEIAESMILSRPDDPAANVKYAEVCVSQMEYEKAAKTYKRLADEFKLFENLFDEASCLIELDDLDGADAALESYPSKEYNEQYWYYKAYIDFKRHDYTEAFVKADKSHSLDPEYMPALYLLIDIESILQEYHAVARYAEEYKRLRPDGEYGYNVCAEAHLILGNISECSRNYYYIYDKIKHDDKYAALAAITAARLGDGRRRSSLLRKLRRKRNEYYYGAMYAIDAKRHSKRDSSMSKFVYKLHSDDEFMLQLAVFLTESGSVSAASHLLNVLSRSGTPPYDVVAQQMRIAAKVGDYKLFDSFFDYYVKTFLDGKLTVDQTDALRCNLGRTTGKTDANRTNKAESRIEQGRPYVVVEVRRENGESVVK
ncbi:MAG: DUF4241 domain-containing protein [Clostridiales bacterium]|nr:DUF4241 domain-containing protein [Clostridiales bacterium]